VLQHVSDHRGSIIREPCTVLGKNYGNGVMAAYAAINTDFVHVNGHDRTILVILAKYCTRLPDDGSSVIQNMLEYF